MTNQTSYADTSAVPGIAYEYWMERTYAGISPNTAVGYICAGVNVPMEESRGKVLLVIDDTLLEALAPEIEQLEADLIGEGWTVQPLTALRTSTAATVKAQIISAYSADPAKVKAVYLLGHVPVAYSGNIAPDGQSDHVGAWPADGYYGELNGTWTDSAVNNSSAARAQNDNVPGDGKFDQNYFPNFVELMVGRVDMHGMTRAPSSSISEAALLRRYLRKAHDFRMRQGAYASVSRRSLIRDDLGYSDGENFSMAGWAWAFTSSGPLIAEAPSGQWFSAAYAGNNTYLIGYGNGSGTYESANSIGTTTDFGLRPSRVVFSSLFGSYFGDWDSDNNLLRATLAGNATGDSLGLVCFWGGRPNRFMHHMGMGETAGYSVWASHNGSLSGGGGYVPNNYAGVHCGLMGDPTLRLFAVEPARNVTAVSTNGLVSLLWSPSTETNLLGYHVYRANAATGSFERLTMSPQAGTSFSDTSVSNGFSYCYQVRALKRETVPGGSFDNLSVGTPLTITVCAEMSAAPRNPTGLTVTPFASTNASLSWVDMANNETGFRIERKVNADGSFSPIGSVPANTTSFTDTGAFVSGNVYYYRIVALGTADNSLPSAVASFDAVAGYFDLPATRLKVYKNAGHASVSVNRIGGSNGVASVQYVTSDVSAFAGTHYAACNGTLVWADGDTSPKTILIPIINTVAPQAGLQFKVGLNAPSSGAGLTINAFAAVLIEDPSASLDPPWAQTIISGITDSSPATTVSNALCSVTLGGTGVSASANYDAGQFIYQSRTGDGVLTAFFPAGTPADSNARYALMVRATSANSAVMAAAVTSSSGSYGTKLAYRSAAGSYSATLPSISNSFVLNRWLRLSRSDGLFIAETSADGITWTTVASMTIAAMPATALWGVFHYSSDWSVTALGNYHLAVAEHVSLADVPAPSSPAGLSAAATAPSQIVLSWPTALHASGYRVERCDESGVFTQVVDLASSLASTQTWADTSLSADSGYAYRVCAYNASGVSDFTPVAYAATPVGDTVTLLSTEGVNASDATVRLDLADTPQGAETDLLVASYDPESWEMATNAAKCYLRFNLSGVTAPTQARLRLTYLGSDYFDVWNYFTLYFYLLGQNSNGWGENSITWNLAPQNDRDGLGFSAPNYDLGSICSYELPSDGQEVFFELNATNLYENRATNNLITIAISQYGGAAMRWASKEHPSSSGPVLEISTPSTLPLRPSFFSAQVESGWFVTLRWASGPLNETGFELERRVVGGEFELLQSLTSNSVDHVDTTTVPSTSYEYRLRAVNASGYSSWTAIMAVTTPDVFHAAGTLWDSGGSDSLVTTPNNWDLDRNPNFTGTAYFNFAAAGSVVSVNSNVSFLGMSIHRDADFTFTDGGGTLALGSGGLRAFAPTAVSRLYTVASKLALASNQNWGVTNNETGVTSLLVSGSISDGAAAYGIAKSGDGLLTLAGNSDYDGTTLVAPGGGIRIAHANGFGSETGFTDVASNGWVEISGSLTVPEPLILRDAGTAGALRSTGGTNVWSGPVTLTAPTRLRASPGSSLRLSGGVSGSFDLLLSPDAGGELVLSGSPINLNTRKVVAYGEGAVTLGSASNTYTTLEVAGLGMRLRMGAANVLPSNCILSVGANYSVQGIVDLNGFDQTVARLVRGNTGTSSNRIVTSSAPATLTVNETSASAIFFNGHLTGALGLTKGAAGYLSLAGTNNTYTGDTTVNGGTLEIGSNCRFGFSPRILVNAGTLKLLTTNAISDSAMVSIADGGAKLRIDSGVETVGALILGGVRKSIGTWGATGSGAQNIDDAHFIGAGVINVLSSPLATWDAGGANTSITTAGNWDFDALPNFAGSSYVIFGLGGSVAMIDSNISFSGMLINRAANFSFADGTGVLSLGAGGLTATGPANTSCVYTIGSKVSLATNQNWVVMNDGTATTTVVMSGPVTDGTATFGISKTGNGLLSLSGNSDYDGTTSVGAGGGLLISHGNALGSVSNGSDIASNGWVEVAGSVTVPESLVLRDAGSAGALRSTAGTNIWTGPVTLAAPTRLRTSSGSCLTLSGGVAGSFDLLLSTEAGSECVLTGGPVKLASRKIVAFGEGTVLIASGSNTFSSLEAAGVGMRVHMGAPNVLPSTCTLSVGAYYSVQGIIDLCGFDQTVARLVRGNTGISSNRIVTSSSPATLTVNETSSSAIFFNGHLTGALALTKSASGYLTLSGTNNTYIGSTTVTSGILEVDTNARLGWSTRIYVNGGTLRLMNANALSDDAKLSILSGGKVFAQSGVDAVSTLYLNGKQQRRGTYGSSASGATYKNDTFFSSSGTGVILVLNGPEGVFLVR